MDKIYCVYMHTNKINNKKYIGLTSQNPINRWSNGEGYIGSPHFYAAIKQYGWQNFEHQIIYDNLDREDACWYEIFLIKKYHTTDPKYGYNIYNGGDLGPNDSTKMIEWQRTHKKFGQDNVNSKKVRCIETKDIFGSIAEAERWAGSTKVGECCRGKRQHAGTHPETKQLLSWEYADENEQVTIVCNIPLQDKQTIKQIYCVNTGEIFNSAAEAGRFYNIAPCNILRVCRGIRQSAGKDPETQERMKWKYIENNKGE